MSHQGAEREARQLEKKVIADLETHAKKNDAYAFFARELDKAAVHALMYGYGAPSITMQLPRGAGKSLLERLMYDSGVEAQPGPIPPLLLIDDFDSSWEEGLDHRERLLLLCK